MEHTIKLLTGYKDAKGVVHRDVTFGKRVTAGDMMLLDADPRSQSVTQYSNLIIRKMITRFGTLAMPVADTILLELDSFDREDLARGADAFMAMGNETRPHEFIDDDTVRLKWGFTIDGVTYTRAQFGRHTTGRDEVDADGKNLNGIARELFIMGRQIVRLGTDADEPTWIDGPVELSSFNAVDGRDIRLLRECAQMWRISFRLKGVIDEKKRDGEGGADHDEGNGDVGDGSAGPAAGEDRDVRTGS